MQSDTRVKTLIFLCQTKSVCRSRYVWISSVSGCSWWRWRRKECPHHTFTSGCTRWEKHTNPEDKISSVGAVQLLGSKAQYSLCLCFVSDSLHWIPALRQQWQHGVPVSSHGNCLYWNGCCYRWWRWGVHGAGSGGVSNLIQAFFFFNLLF